MILTDPLSIGQLTLLGRVMLAPMAGVTAWPTRLLCREMGCAFAVTEMVSVKSILYSPDMPAVLDLLERGDEEGPLALQLFGAEPSDFSGAIALLNDRGRLAAFDAVDINMGCPAQKITRSGAGSALLLDLPRAARIVAATVRAVESTHPAMPVTVKTRLGWGAGDRSAVRLARMAWDEGAAAVTVHGRTRDQQYSGDADLEGVAAVKAAVSIPVIGNGDVASRADAERMIRETHCDGVMIGRSAIGNPWVFSRVLHSEAVEPTAAERLAMALRHARIQCAWRGGQRGMVELRGQLGWYMKGLPGAATWRASVYGLGCVGALEAFIKTIGTNTNTSTNAGGMNDGRRKEQADYIGGRTSQAGE
ncbi:MAG: tRNA dihydrouridine synthase DusB [Oscillospiraceae bacterium]|jgi:nifR3 family TIM-barrel protein|nr:tRNA dihydrouridine synthase DusB [Oscillospiraceae bacterium]